MGTLLGWTGKDSPVVAIVTVVLGGLVFADIMRRDRRERRTEMYLRSLTWKVVERL